MPGEEEEDIVMTSTQCNLLNTTCPLTGKPVFELADPIRRYSENTCKLPPSLSTRTNGYGFFPIYMAGSVTPVFTLNITLFSSL